MSDEHSQLLSAVNRLVFDEHSKERPVNVLLEFLILQSLTVCNYSFVVKSYVSIVSSTYMVMHTHIVLLYGCS